MCPALFADLVVKGFPVPIVAVREVTVVISALFAKRDQIEGIELERGSQVKRRYVVDLELPGPAAPLTGRLA